MVITSGYSGRIALPRPRPAAPRLPGSVRSSRDRELTGEFHFYLNRVNWNVPRDFLTVEDARARLPSALRYARKNRPLLLVLLLSRRARTRRCPSCSLVSSASGRCDATGRIRETCMLAARTIRKITFGEEGSVRVTVEFNSMVEIRVILHKRLLNNFVKYEIFL